MRISKKIAFITGVILIAIRFYSFRLIPDRIYDYLELLSLCIIIIFSLIYKRHNKFTKRFFFYNITALIVFTLLSSIPAYIFHDQSFVLSLLASRTIWYWLFYFVLMSLNPDEHKLENILVNIGLIWSIIMIIQQITYPTLLFARLSEIETNAFAENSLNQRGGIARIFVTGGSFAIFSTFYFWIKLKKTKTKQYIIPFIINLVGLFLLATRQITFGLILILILDFLFSNKLNSKKSIRFGISIFVFVCIAFPFISNYIDSLISLTKTQNLETDNNIRILEVEYFLFEYWEHWLSYFLGNGWEHLFSNYGKEMNNYVSEILNFYRSDIGLIGAFNKFGLFYIMSVLSIFYKVIIPNKKIYVPEHYRLFFIMIFITAFTGQNPFEMSDKMLLFSTLFFMIDSTNNKLAYK